MRAVEITDEHREWLKENYAHLSNRQCRKHIGCGYERLKVLVEQLGLQWKSDTKAVQVKRNRHSDTDSKGGYCMDCSKYWKTTCGKTGKDVGALWQKKCFE